MILDFIVLQINPEDHQICDPKYKTMIVEGDLTYNPYKTRKDHKTTFRSNIRKAATTSLSVKILGRHTNTVYVHLYIRISIP